MFGDFKEYDILTHKQVNNFGSEIVKQCVITCDNQFLITGLERKNFKLTKNSIRTNTVIHGQRGISESGLDAGLSSILPSFSQKKIGWLSLR